ncbi:OsmC family protein [Pseudomonas sp. TTU2014-080ASC]|uniref:OsmC family protein n=1 Tax=Pseudomonas sp. TTU2014-080ASC TaxID=1729724 RepID=UPI0007189E99|nr:OsmC family protein [Pseudomonas sp. TTU2014-080ASC]KRW59794.1 peroxiredoxin [Pseudomonas sp. TTU2014-080ASC]
MINVKTEKGLLHRIEIGAHTLHTDVSEALGGTDAAPDPHDYFDAALGACKALTLSLFAKQRGIPLESVDVQLNRDNSDERKGMYRLNVELDLIGPLDDAQREQLLRIADKCPIHKLMTSTEVEITTLLSERSYG